MKPGSKARARLSTSSWRWGRSTRARPRGCGIGKTRVAITEISCTSVGNLRDLLAHWWNGKPTSPPTKKDGGKPRQYTIDLHPGEVATIFQRVQACLREPTISLDGEQVPAMIPGWCFMPSATTTRRESGSGVYFMCRSRDLAGGPPRVAALEGRGGRARLPKGSLKIKMLNERAEFAHAAGAIMWSCGRIYRPERRPLDISTAREEMFGTIRRW